MYIYICIYLCHMYNAFEALCMHMFVCMHVWKINACVYACTENVCATRYNAFEAVCIRMCVYTCM